MITARGGATDSSGFLRDLAQRVDLRLFIGNDPFEPGVFGLQLL
jgi:hypothetical protein